jgi:DNA helicase-2/ATP-dependent DNA helicase PcrA
MQIQRSYEDIKDERRRMDLEDVLLATAGMLSSEPGVLKGVREQYRTFVVDEYQDVSPIQHTLLQLWVGDRRDLCVVGDANQTIYSFAGASAEYLLRFHREYPDAEVHRLERSHRSSQAVIEVANRVIRGRPGALVLVPAGAAASSGRAPGATEQLPITAHPSDRAEAQAIAAAVRADLASGVPSHEIAVLVRLNAQVPVIEAALREAAIAVTVRGDARFWEQPHVREAVVHLVAAKRMVAADQPTASAVRGVLAGLGWAPGEPPADLPAAAKERWAALDALHRMAEVDVSYGRFVDDLLERQARGDGPVEGNVTVATIHSAKGLEWDSVHLAGLSEGLLPISYATTESEVEEERRLLYVAVTRARSRLRLTWSRRGSAAGPERTPSRFIADLSR